MRKFLLSILIALMLLLPGCSGEADQVGQFSYSKYLEYYGISENSDLFPDNTQPVESAQEARRTALEVWTIMYGPAVLFQQPYEVSYDNVAGVWFVTGTLSTNTEGGVAVILIEASTGKILDCWHGK